MILFLSWSFLTCLSGVMASKSGFKAGGPRSFPRRDSMSLLGNFDIVNLF